MYSPMMLSVVQVHWCDTKFRISLPIMQQCYWNLAAMLHPRNIPDGTHFDVAMATCLVPVSCLFKMKYCHLWLNKAKYLVLSKTYASPTFIKGSLSTSVLCGHWVVWLPFSLILKLQLSEPWLFLRIVCACEQFMVRCLKASLHRRISIFICVFFSIELSLCPKNPDFVVVGLNVVISSETL